MTQSANAQSTLNDTFLAFISVKYFLRLGKDSLLPVTGFKPLGGFIENKLYPNSYSKLMLKMISLDVNRDMALVNFMSSILAISGLSRSNTSPSPKYNLSSGASLK